MAVEENLIRNKVLYKITLIIIKFIPLGYTLCSLLNTVLSYLEINVDIISYIASVSLFTIILLYILSYVFKFCIYHRLFIHYTVITWILNIIDMYIGIPVSNFCYLGIQLIIFGIILLVIGYLHVKRNKGHIT